MLVATYAPIAPFCVVRKIGVYSKDVPLSPFPTSESLIPASNLLGLNQGNHGGKEGKQRASEVSGIGHVRNSASFKSYAPWPSRAPSCGSLVALVNMRDRVSSHSNYNTLK